MLELSLLASAVRVGKECTFTFKDYANYRNVYTLHHYQTDPKAEVKDDFSWIRTPVEDMQDVQACILQIERLFEMANEPAFASSIKIDDLEVPMPYCKAVLRRSIFK